MKKKIILLPIALFILTILSSLPCDEQWSCTGPLSDYSGYLGLWFLGMIPLTLLALTLQDQKHKFWLKFTGVFFIISMILVFITPEYGSGIVSIDRELVNWFFVGFYSFISIVYFVVQFFRRKSLVVN